MMAKIEFFKKLCAVALAGCLVAATSCENKDDGDRSASAENAEKKNQKSALLVDSPYPIFANKPPADIESAPVQTIEENGDIPEKYLNAKHTFDASLFAGVTEDDALKQYLTTYTNPTVGEVVGNDNKGKDLIYRGKKIFSYDNIVNRTASNKGKVAVEVFKNIDPSDNNGGLVKNSHEVWILENGESEMLFDSNVMTASIPLISPSGKKLAATVQIYGEEGYLSPKMLAVVDLDQYTIQYFSGNDEFDDYHIGAMEWIDNETSLIVIQDYGEARGNMSWSFLDIE